MTLTSFYLHTQIENHILGLLVTQYDCFSDDLSFVFGVARSGVGALVSTARLGNDRDFVIKECVHEVCVSHASLFMNECYSDPWCCRSVTHLDSITASKKLLYNHRTNSIY
eukprot:TRINITY_DN3281_c0_g1_i3.p1 TRINITY_DN3281_c0_g1~~TRINITY_DN3281_c0_g1_i3.p1  ORF type:complete len:111 (+),score=2.34 TRINITY_DN3281_c0_g1_i3:115-447(+)